MPTTENSRIVIDAAGVHVLQEAEVVDDARADEDLEHEQQPALLEQVGLAGLVDDVRDVEHRLVRRHAPSPG